MDWPSRRPDRVQNGWPRRDGYDLGGTLAVVGSLGNSGGGAINNQDQVIGTSTLAGDQTIHPFLWQHGVLRDLGTLGGADGEAYWINEAGDVVGRADFSPSSTDHHAFLWRHGVMTDLGVLGTHPCSTAVAVNAKGQVIGDTGICGSGGGPGFLSENGGQIVDLNTLVRFPIPGLMVGDVAFINDRGEIAAKGRLANGIRHDLLLIPCDLDHSDNKDCQDVAEGDGIMNQSGPAPVTQSLVGDSEGGSEARSNTRLNRSFRIPGNGSSSKN